MEANFNYRAVEGSLVRGLVSDSDPGGNNSNNSDTNVQTVTLASPLNGQFYVIGSPSELLGGGASLNQRSIAPRTLTLEGQMPGTKMLDLKDLTRTGGNITEKIAREEKLGNRRATHNEVERRRRDNINHWILKLGKLIPPEVEEDPLTMNGQKQALSKGGILAKACEYLTEVRETNNFLRESLAEKEEIIADNERLHTENTRLQREAAQLRSQLNQISQMGGHKPGSSIHTTGAVSLLADSPPPGGGRTGSLHSSEDNTPDSIIKRDINFGL